jgi:hypothetical protein
MTRGARTLISAVVTLGLTGGTALASRASTQRASIEQLPDDPVSIRHESIAGRGFFGSWTGRSHWGGGLHGGK